MAAKLSWRARSGLPLIMPKYRVGAVVAGHHGREVPGGRRVVHVGPVEKEALTDRPLRDNPIR